MLCTPWSPEINLFGEKGGREGGRGGSLTKRTSSYLSEHSMSSLFVGADAQNKNFPQTGHQRQVRQHPLLYTTDSYYAPTYKLPKYKHMHARTNFNTATYHIPHFYCCIIYSQTNYTSASASPSPPPLSPSLPSPFLSYPHTHTHNTLGPA